MHRNRASDTEHKWRDPIKPYRESVILDGAERQMSAPRECPYEIMLGGKQMDGLPEPQLRQVFVGVRDYILLRDGGPAAVADARAHDANWLPHIFEAFGENLRGVIEEAVALKRRWWWPFGSRREKHP